MVSNYNGRRILVSGYKQTNNTVKFRILFCTELDSNQEKNILLSSLRMN